MPPQIVDFCHGLLEAEFANAIKCVYIDPPFNTGQAMENYDDGLEHSIWLSLMRDRIELIHRLLAETGTLFVHIDDNELGYLIVLLDEIFGRNNRLYVVTFKQGSATGHKSINPGCVNTSNFILIYAKNKASWGPNRVFTARERDDRYNQFIENRDQPSSNWRFIPLSKAFAMHLGINGTPAEIKKRLTNYEEQIEKFVNNNANSVIQFARPDYSAVSEAARRIIDASKASPGKVFCLPRQDHSDMYFVGGQRCIGPGEVDR